MAKEKVFNKLDLWEVYYQVRIKEGVSSKWLSIALRILLGPPFWTARDPCYVYAANNKVLQKHLYKGVLVT